MSQTELEIRIAHLELSLQTLGDELARQQRHQQRIDAELAALRERLAAAGDDTPQPPEPPPPHY